MLTVQHRSARCGITSYQTDRSNLPRINGHQESWRNRAQMKGRIPPSR